MISTDDIHAITGNVFTTMLDFELEAAGDVEASDGSEPITGCVQISGEWNGAVMVEMNAALASDAARKMLAIDEAEVELIDCQDTIAELTNMIGGNIKSLLPGPSSLSLPSVTTGNASEIRVVGTVEENSVPFLCNNQQVRVVLYGSP